MGGHRAESVLVVHHAVVLLIDFDGHHHVVDVVAVGSERKPEKARKKQTNESREREHTHKSKRETWRRVGEFILSSLTVLVSKLGKTQ